MKAVVTEVKDGVAAVLKEDGTFIKIKRQCSVGDTIELTEKEFAGERRNRSSRMVWIVSRAAIVLLACGIGFGVYYYTVSAAAYVKVGVGERKVTLAVNRLNQVINVESDDAESEELVEELYSKGVKLKSLPEVLRTVAEGIETEEPDTGKEEIIVNILTKDEGTFDKLKEQAEENGFHVVSGSGSEPAGVQPQGEIQPRNEESADGGQLPRNDVPENSGRSGIETETVDAGKAPQSNGSAPANNELAEESVQPQAVEPENGEISQQGEPLNEEAQLRDEYSHSTENAPGVQPDSVAAGKPVNYIQDSQGRIYEFF